MGRRARTTTPPSSAKTGRMPPTARSAAVSYFAGEDLKLEYNTVLNAHRGLSPLRVRDRLVHSAQRDRYGRKLSSGTRPRRSWDTNAPLEVPRVPAFRVKAQCSSCCKKEFLMRFPVSNSLEMLEVSTSFADPFRVSL
jgi:hypothetical protein